MASQPIPLEPHSGAAAPDDIKPFISPDAKLPELTILPLIVGALLGIVFGASSMYLVLKVGMTVSASIPVAVLSITIFRAFSKMFGVRRATILENNIVQTAGSAGESIAFGVGVTMPALLILGYNLEIGRVMLVGILGGLLGILMMIPLRRALIVKEHKTLVYPEGTACAEVLMVGEKGGMTAKAVFAGLGVGGLFKLAYSLFGAWKDVPEKILGKWYDGGAVSIEVAPELLGVGYIIGTTTALVMGAGGVLSSLVLIPAIKLFGGALTTPVYPATKLIKDMSIDEVWHSYVLYIGAGAVAAGGIISLIRSLPTIVGGAVRGIQSLRGGVGGAGPQRTDKDLPMSFVIIGSLGLLIACALAPPLMLNHSLASALMGGLLIVAFGFLFVTVSSRLTGEIGSSSNPISGMTVATLLLTSLVFLGLGWVSAPYKVAALSVAAIVCIAASNGGTTSQDLKTGYLVGATPWMQQVAILVGALSSTLVIGFVILRLNAAGTVFQKQNFPQYTANVATLTETQALFGPEAANDHATYHVLRLREPDNGVPPGKYLVDDAGHILYLEDPGINGAINKRDDGSTVVKYSAPKAVLMSFIIDGIMSQKLPWGLVLIGAFIAIVVELCGLSSLAFAVGVYLPLSTSTPIMAGGIVRWLVDRKSSRDPDANLLFGMLKRRSALGRVVAFFVERPGGAKQQTAAEAESGPGVLFSSGLIAGGSIAGMLVAFASGLAPTLLEKCNLTAPLGWFAQSNSVSFVLFLGLSGVLWLVATERLLKPPASQPGA